MTSPHNPVAAITPIDSGMRNNGKHGRGEWGKNTVPKPVALNWIRAMR